MPYDPHQPGKPVIAVIIPVYNEELNVTGVLRVLHGISNLDEIIVVDDGSTDNTFKVLNQAAKTDRRIQVVRHEQNKGKGQAVFSGWAATCAQVLLLLDADLKALNPDHVQALLRPVIEHRADMTLGLFRGGHFGTDFSHWMTPFLTGQRGLRAELLKYVSREAAEGYGFEVALTVAAAQQHFRRRVVMLKGVWHPSSELRNERGIWGGLGWRLKMYGQIIRAWYISTRTRGPKAKGFFPNTSKL
jgi:glycosyltransferase involved in cell wall biosynthesis